MNYGSSFAFDISGGITRPHNRTVRGALMAASRSKLEERSGQPRTLREVTRLVELTAWNVPASETEAEFGRSEDAVRAKARSENVSLSMTSTPSDGATRSTYRRVAGVGHEYFSSSGGNFRRYVWRQPGRAMLISAAAGFILGILLGGSRHQRQSGVGFQWPLWFAFCFRSLGA